MGKKKKEKKPRKPRDPNAPRKPPAPDNVVLLAKLRSAFTRSSYHRAVIEALIVQHQDPERPRVKTWCRCPKCGQPDARSYFEVDHMEPVRPIEMTVEQFLAMDRHALLDRVYCDVAKLQGLCPQCHREKTNLENAERRKVREANKKICGKP